MPGNVLVKICTVRSLREYKVFIDFFRRVFIHFDVFDLLAMYGILPELLSH